MSEAELTVEERVAEYQAIRAHAIRELNFEKKRQKAEQALAARVEEELVRLRDER